MNTTEQSIRDAVAQAFDTAGVGQDEAPSRPQTVRSYVAHVPQPKADPRFKEYGEQLLEAARTPEADVLDWSSFWEWRQAHPEIQGTGAITLIRLYKESRVLDTIASL